MVHYCKIQGTLSFYFYSEPPALDGRSWSTLLPDRLLISGEITQAQFTNIDIKYVKIEIIERFQKCYVHKNISTWLVLFQQ